MSTEKPTPSSENPPREAWQLASRKPGEDPLWDSLGDDWQGLDGVFPDARLYVRWHVEEGKRPKVTGFCISGEVTTDMLRKIPVSRLENVRQLMDGHMDRLAANNFEKVGPLRRSKGESPESFSRTVAWYYKLFSARSSKPTKDLAEHAGVPLPTMRSWIREARLRGELPPGTPGKPG